MKLAITIHLNGALPISSEVGVADTDEQVRLEQHFIRNMLNRPIFYYEFPGNLTVIIPTGQIAGIEVVATQDEDYREVNG